jgi:hypothetical protein
MGCPLEQVYKLVAKKRDSILELNSADGVALNFHSPLEEP